MLFKYIYMWGMIIYLFTFEALQHFGIHIKRLYQYLHRHINSLYSLQAIDLNSFKSLKASQIEMIHVFNSENERSSTRHHHQYGPI